MRREAIIAVRELSRRFVDDMITGVQLDAGDRRQVQRDIASLRERLDAIPEEIVAEHAAITRRYAEPTDRLFPSP